MVCVFCWSAVGVLFLGVEMWVEGYRVAQQCREGGIVEEGRSKNKKQKEGEKREKREEEEERVNGDRSSGKARRRRETTMEKGDG